MPEEEKKKQEEGIEDLTGDVGEDELEDQLENDLAKELTKVSFNKSDGDKLFRTKAEVLAAEPVEEEGVPEESDGSELKDKRGRRAKTPIMAGEAYEFLAIKLFLQGASPHIIEKELRKLGHPATILQLSYYKKFYAGQMKQRYESVCKIHRDILEHSLNNLREKLGNNAASLSQINYYISVLNVEIEIVRNYTPELAVGDREELLEKLIGRVQNLMTLKNKYIGDLDRKDNVKKIVSDIIQLSTETLISPDIPVEKQKELLDNFKIRVREYVGFME